MAKRTPAEPAEPDKTKRHETEPGEVELTPFETDVLEMVGGLSEGEVVTYGEVAAEVGKPGAARAVGSTLRRHGSGVPWWRVVASNGRLVPGNEIDHTARLRAEGVAMRNGKVMMHQPESP